ncbi:competence type IV pilus assembly protein ComGB [Bacillus manliponensis]|uniref:competence type IV pilus assembly protein ComGB n=1 Tax=Bacillus manliponensis TaxID=574376 RepID=UPI0035120188
MFNKMKWRLHEQALLMKRLGELLTKGYSLLHALEFLQLHLQAEKKKQLCSVIEELKKGRSLHDVFQQLTFHADLLSYLFYAEKHGDIAFALQQGSVLLQRKDKRQKDIMKVLRYPLFLSVFLLAILLVFNLVLLPQFSTLYKSLQTETSSFTDTILTCIELLPYVIGGFLSLLGIAVFIYIFYIKQMHSVKRMDMFMRLPMINSFLRLMNSHYFATQLSALLQGGLSVLEALTLMSEQKHQPFFQYEAIYIKDLLTKGEQLDCILMNRRYYEIELSFIMTHGQANGNLAAELRDYSEMIMEKTEEKMNKTLFIIQPILFACIGLTVVLMYLAMIMPMFQMMDTM